MKQWELHYRMENRFSSPVTQHAFSLRCFPRGMSSQEIRRLEYTVSPCSDQSRSRDSFGNTLLTGHCDENHSRFLVQVNALVCVRDRLEPEARPGYHLGILRVATPLTRMSKSLESFHRILPGRSGERDWVRTQALMAELHGHFSYVSGSTHFHTTAAQAWDQGCGVCQDYAHILLALCREERMTARYAAGAIAGEGQTHAWVQVWQDGFWKGFDPTHNRPTNEDYICFAVGRDADDCALNRGIFRGNAEQEQEVTVQMIENPLE